MLKHFHFVFFAKLNKHFCVLFNTGSYNSVFGMHGFAAKFYFQFSKKSFRISGRYYRIPDYKLSAFF